MIVAYDSSIIPVSGYALVLGRNSFQYTFSGFVASGNLYIPNTYLSQLPAGEYTALPQVLDAESLVYFLDEQDLQIIEVPDYPNALVLTSAASVLDALQMQLNAETAARIAADSVLQAQISALSTQEAADIALVQNQIVATSGQLHNQLLQVITDYQAADVVVSGYLTQQFTAADTSVRSEFAAADVVVSGYLTQKFIDADTSLRSLLEGEFQAADVSVSGYLTSQFTSADANLRSLLEGEFAAADVVVSGYLTNQFTVADADLQSQITSHVSDTNNPHNVTAAQVGALTVASGDTRYSLINHTHQFNQLLNIPSTVSGYGIADALAYTDRSQTFNGAQAISGTLATSGLISVRADPSTATGYAVGLYVPTLSGDTGTAGYFGSRDASNNRSALIAESTNAPAMQLTSSGQDTLRAYNLGTQPVIFLIREGDTQSNTVSIMLRVANRTRGSAVAEAGFGSALDFLLASDTTNDRQAARITALWLDPREASRSSALTLSTVVAGGSFTERLRITPSGALLIGKISGLSGTGDLDIAGNLNVTGTITQAGGITTEVVTDFTANGTFIIPSGAKFIRILAIGPGGGGGSGRRGAANTARLGGGGGGAGSTVDVIYTVAEAIGTNNTLSVVIPSSGTGGAARSADDADGAAGGNAGNTTVSNNSGRVITFAGGGVGGAGGTASTGTGGSAGIGTTVAGAGGSSSSSATGAAGGTSNGLAAGAGGAGGGISASNTAFGGGSGGHGSRSLWSSVAATGGTVDTTGPQNGGTPGLYLPGGGGGGGAASITTTAQTGGNGGTYGGGGGGGGASVNGQTSGGGGNGGPGFVRIFAW
jgi:hypothetical protein